jgi:hypothetical protein
MIPINNILAFYLHEVHHGPMAFAGFASVVFLFLWIYISVSDKFLSKLKKPFWILFTVLYILAAFVSLNILVKISGLI